MLKKQGLVLPLICLTLMGIFLCSTLVLYQAYYAYFSAYQNYQAIQHQYALTGLFNQAVDECIKYIRANGNFKAARTYEITAWNTSLKKSAAYVAIQPFKDYYLITAILGPEQKSGKLSFNGKWLLKFDG